MDNRYRPLRIVAVAALVVAAVIATEPVSSQGNGNSQRAAITRLDGREVVEGEVSSATSRPLVRSSGGTRSSRSTPKPHSPSGGAERGTCHRAGTLDDAIEAIESAIQAKEELGEDANVRIVSNSWGLEEDSQALRDQVDAANQADMLFVAAAGNSSMDNDAAPMIPAAFDNPNVIAVAATDHSDELAYFSNYGD